MYGIDPLPEGARWLWRRQVAAQAERTNGKPNPRHVVASLRGRARTIHEVDDGAPGDLEHRIKKRQYGFFSDRGSCHRLRTSRPRAASRACTGALGDHFRHAGLKGTALERTQSWTIRKRLFRAAARVTISVRRVGIQISGTRSNADILHRALRNPARWSTGPSEWRRRRAFASRSMPPPART
ncbi:MAG: transposase [Phycisphaerales bacterium]